jgi:molybdenum-dependent DNA-binding transcriptional regulator ModE
MQPNPTLDQLQILVAVADTGSFSAAGRKLNRAQSVISYGIANLEAQLGLKLFEREGTREPQLTDIGRAMLEDARRMVGVLQRIRSRVDGHRQGWRPKSPYRPMARRFAGAGSGAEGFRSTVSDGDAAFAYRFSGPVIMSSTGRPISASAASRRCRVPSTHRFHLHGAVRGASHPLALLPKPVPVEDVREHPACRPRPVGRNRAGRRVRLPHGG